MLYFSRVGLRNSAFYDGQVVNDAAGLTRGLLLSPKESVKRMEENIEDYIFAPCEKWNFHTAIRRFDGSVGGSSDVDFRCTLTVSFDSTCDYAIIIYMI